MVAHRGASVAEQENTVAAFLAAGRLGADGVELDVRRCGSGELVVHHDPALGDGRPVCEVASAALPSWLPSLDEAWRACAGMALNVEIKNLPFEHGHDADETVAAEVAAWVAAEGIVEQVLVSAFTPTTLDAVRSAQAEVATGLLLLVPDDPAALVAAAVAAGHVSVHPHHSGVDAALVRAAHASGVMVCPWTVDEPGRIAELADMGVDAVITNVPDVARRVVGG